MGIANRRSRDCPCASKGVKWWGKTARLSAPFRHFVKCRIVSLGQRATPTDGTPDEGEAQHFVRPGDVAPRRAGHGEGGAEATLQTQPQLRTRFQHRSSKKGAFEPS
jgi:hypothetical protein